MTSRLPKAVRDALAKLEPQVQRAFLEAIGDITKAADLQAVIRALEVGDVEAAVRAMRFEATLFGAVDRSLEEAYRAGGIAAIGSLPVIRDPFDGGRIALGFDGRHPRAERWARDMSSRLIVEIVEDQRNMARDVIRQGLEAGRGPRSTALDIVGRVNKTTKRREGGLIGLTSNQAQWVKRAEDQLRDGDYSGYLGRDLRNKQFDKLIARAERDGRALTEAEIGKISTAYRNNILRYRGETIARTETITAYRAGNQEGFRQLVDTGAVRDDQIVRTWGATGDLRTRVSHNFMNGVSVRGLDTPWNVSGSLMMYPGDTSLGAAAEHTINCRCYETIRINYDADNGGAANAPAPDPEPLPPSSILETPLIAAQGFSYQTLPRPKTLKDAEEYIVQNNVATKADFSGVKAKLLPTAAVASLEVVEKFSISPIDWFGPLTKFGLKSKQVSKANAAIVRSSKRNLATGEIKPHNGLHIAGNFSESSLDRQQFLNKEYAPKYHADASKEIDASPQIAADVKERFSRMGENEYAWTYSGLLGAEDHAAAIIYHEYGHVLHLIDGRIGSRINEFIASEKPLDRGWNYLLSKYASTNDREYVAEAFSLYMHAPESQHYRIHPALLKIFREEDKSYVN